MGQTKVLIVAKSFGPEFNLSGNQEYRLKDYVELIARSTTDISGGTKQNIKVVAPTDKSQLLISLDAQITKQLLMLSQSQNDPLLIANSGFVSAKKIDLNREIGEETDMLLATAKLSIKFHQIPQDQKQKLVNTLVLSQATQAGLKFNPQDFRISFINPPKDVKYSGELKVSGWLEPIVSVQGLSSKLTLRTPNTIPQILKKEVNRFYDWEINSRLGYINIIPLLPLFPNQIHLQFKVK